MPIAPNATSFLQVADTHIHSPLKSHIQAQKSRLQAEYDEIAVSNGQARFASWGIQEFASVMGEAWTQMTQLQSVNDLVLHGAIKNQLLAFRPDEEGILQRVDQIEAEWARVHPLLPPSKGITYHTANQRLQSAAHWPSSGPPEPDWKEVDQMGSYLHQIQEVPGREEAELDMRFQDLELTPQQIHMTASPESRLKNFVPVRHGVEARMASRKRVEKAQLNKARVKPSPWAQKLSARYNRAFAEASKRKLQAAGSTSALSNTIMPVASGAKALKRKLVRARADARAGARKRLQKGAPGAPGQPEVKITYQLVTDHQFLGERTRVISPVSHPNLLGKIAVCQVVQLRKLHQNDPGKLICTIELASLGP